jgi:hypothetical protein
MSALSSAVSYKLLMSAISTRFIFDTVPLFRNIIIKRAPVGYFPFQICDIQMYLDSYGAEISTDKIIQQECD